MTQEEQEDAYLQGERQVWATLLKECHKNLGYTDPEDQLRAQLMAERESIIQSLRSLCRVVGDNEWDEELHLQDVIEKHLADPILEVGGLFDMAESLADAAMKGDLKTLIDTAKAFRERFPKEEG